MRTLALLCWLALAGVAGAAPEHGLMWNRSGLPLVFPLQIRTDPGRDVAMVLRDAETGEAEVAAYIEGGRFFRVLVPPGTFTLEFASGTEWEGMDTLFGAETRRFTYPEPLTFAIEGVARKAGHLIDLRGDGRMAQRPIGLCQRFARAPVDPDRPGEGAGDRVPGPRDDETGTWDPRDTRTYGGADRRLYDYRDPRRGALLERRNLHVFPSPDGPSARPLAPRGPARSEDLVERLCG